MNYIAFLLGLVGSMHCLVMCGPLVAGVAKVQGDNDILSKFINASVYNLGRLSAYIILGLLFSVVGSTLSIIGFQKIASILTGLFLIGLLFFSLDIERFIFKFSATERWYRSYFNFLSNKIISLTKKTPVAVGFLNGLLPCGMVYVALAGALASPTIWEGILLMFLFGLGTMPMMMSVMMGAGWLAKFKSISARRLIPLAQLCLGAYLIYRGITVDAPLEFDFYMALKNPVMCH